MQPLTLTSVFMELGLEEVTRPTSGLVLLLVAKQGKY